MLPLVYSTRETQIIEVMRAMEKRSEGWKTFAVKNIDGIADNAKPGAGNGTDGLNPLHSRPRQRPAVHRALGVVFR